MTATAASNYNFLNFPTPLYGGLIVQGTVNTKQHCPVCGLKFLPKFLDAQGFYCPTCKTRPTRYCLSLRGFDIGEIYSDPKTDKVFETYTQALDVLVAINRQHRENGKKFNPNDWIKSKVVEKRTENIIPVWLKNHEEETKKIDENTARVKTLAWFNQKKYICDTYIKEFFQGKGIDLIDDNDIEGFYHYLLEKKFASKYIKQILSILKSILKRYRPADTLKFPKFAIVPKKEKQRLGLAREIAIMDKVSERYGYRIAILMLIRTGMRNNEVIALKVHNMIDGIAWVDNAISCDGEFRPSRKSGGSVPYRLTPELWTMAIKHIGGKKEDDYVFEIDGKPLGKSRLNKVFTKACKDAGVKPISLQQAARHSTASRIKEEYDKQATEKIAKQLGHENLTTQKHYIIDESA